MEENKNTLEVQETLDIWRFKGTTLPKEFLDFFPNLKHLNLGNCLQLRFLPDCYIK